MRILMTQREPIHRGGSEMFTIEVAVELRRSGHDVAVYCPRAGDLAKFILAAGVGVKFGLLRERIHELERDVRLLRLKNQALIDSF